MFYRKFELSQSLNGDKVLHIARNPAGVVVLREATEKKLMAAIDKYIAHLETVHKTLQKPSAQSQSKVDKNKKIAPVVSDVEILLPPPQKATKRGPDGKFISRSQIEMSDIKPPKKTLWQKLTS